MKHISFLLWFAFLAFGLSSASLHAQGTSTLIFDLANAVEIAPNQYALPVQYESTGTIFSIDFTMDYDETSISVEEVEVTSQGAADGLNMSFNAASNDELVLTSFSLSGSLTTSPVFNIIFNVTGDGLYAQDLGTITVYINGAESPLLFTGTQPIVNAMPTCLPALNTDFFVEVYIEFGTSNNYELIDGDGNTIPVTTNGLSYSLGPYPNGLPVDIAVVDLADPANSISITNLVMDCSVSVMGCTDAAAHNYNSTATIDDGNCETCIDGVLNGDELGIDCGGTNPNCISCTPPNIQVQTFCDPIDPANFYIQAEVNYGSSTSYEISNSFDGNVIGVAADGVTHVLGPFPNGILVDVTVTDLVNGFLSATIPNIADDCSSVNNPPTNDDCLGARMLIQGSACNSTPGSFLSATGSLPSSSCGYTDYTNDVWYSFEATEMNAAVELTANTITVVEIFANNCNDLVSLYCSATNLINGSNILTVSNLIVGETYFVRVYTIDDLSSTDMDFNICVYGLSSFGSQPYVEAEAVCVDGDDDNFYVDLSLITGEALTYTISNSNNGSVDDIAVGDAVLLGPFSNGDTISIQLSDGSLGGFTFTSVFAQSCFGIIANAGQLCDENLLQTCSEVCKGENITSSTNGTHTIDNDLEHVYLLVENSIRIVVDTSYTGTFNTTGLEGDYSVYSYSHQIGCCAYEAPYIGFTIDAIQVAADNNICADLAGSCAFCIYDNRVRIKTFLQGAYDPAINLMNTNLLTDNLLPLAQPFNRPPWNYTGSESIANNNDFPGNATDWVLVELRDANLNMVSQRAAILLNDGTVVSHNYTSNYNDWVYFEEVACGNEYHIIIRHRNHLAIVSQDILPMPNTNPHDLTIGSNIMQAVSQAKEVAPDTYAMIAGDIDGSGVITVADFNAFVSQAGNINQYLEADANLDGNVTVTDFNTYQPNNAVIGLSVIRY